MTRAWSSLSRRNEPAWVARRSLCRRSSDAPRWRRAKDKRPTLPTPLTPEYPRDRGGDGSGGGGGGEM